MMKTKIFLLAGLLLASFSCKKEELKPDLKKGLVSYFNFDDNLIDQQGYAGDGVPTGNPAFIDGKKGKALDLNGIDQWVEFQASPTQSPSNISYAFWLNAKPQNSDGYERLIVYFIDINNSTAHVSLDQNSVLSSGLGLQAGWAETGIASNTWTHVAVTFDGNANKLYINGVLVDTNQAEAEISSYFTNLIIGYNTDSNKYFKGSVDELYLYNRALSQAEVKQLYNLK